MKISPLELTAAQNLLEDGRGGLQVLVGSQHSGQRRRLRNLVFGDFDQRQALARKRDRREVGRQGDGAEHADGRGEERRGETRRRGCAFGRSHWRRVFFSLTFLKFRSFDRGNATIFSSSSSSFDLVLLLHHHDRLSDRLAASFPSAADGTQRKDARSSIAAA